MAVILNSAILNSTILDSAIIVFPLKLTHTCQDWFPTFAQKNFIHSLWLNLMMAAILNSAMLNSDNTLLDSDTLLSSLRFTQKHSHSTLTLTQTYLIWLTWWWQPSWILPSWILPSCIQPYCTKKTLLIYSHSCDDGSHLEFCYLGLSHFAQNKLYSFILTQLDDGSHLEFCHVGFSHCLLGFRHLVIFSPFHSKKLSLHSDSDSN